MICDVFRKMWVCLPQCTKRTSIAYNVHKSIQSLTSSSNVWYNHNIKNIRQWFNLMMTCVIYLNIFIKCLIFFIFINIYFIFTFIESINQFLLTTQNWYLIPLYINHNVVRDLNLKRCISAFDIWEQLSFITSITDKTFWSTTLKIDRNLI